MNFFGINTACMSLNLSKHMNYKCTVAFQLLTFIKDYQVSLASQKLAFLKPCWRLCVFPVFLSLKKELEAV